MVNSGTASSSRLHEDHISQHPPSLFHFLSHIFTSLSVADAALSDHDTLPVCHGAWSVFQTVVLTTDSRPISGNSRRLYDHITFPSSAAYSLTSSNYQEVFKCVSLSHSLFFLFFFTAATTRQIMCPVSGSLYLWPSPFQHSLISPLVPPAPDVLISEYNNTAHHLTTMLTTYE